MKLRGVLDTSLGNFLCLRGYAKMGDLFRISEAKEYQRGLNKKHKEDIARFVDKGEFHFYPEVILGATLATNPAEILRFNEIINRLDGGKKFKVIFGQMTLQCFFSRSKSSEEGRVYDYLRRGVLTVNNRLINSDKLIKLSRIDGHHRLSIIDPKVRKYKDINTPFCIVFFRSEEEAEKFGAALFHNINHKALPLPMEDSLRLILENIELFPDDKLKRDPSFGWPYYLARKLLGKIDYDMVPNVKKTLENQERSFLVMKLGWLIKEKILGENENAIQRFKQALAEVNTLYGSYPVLVENKNIGLLGAFIYYQLWPERLVKSFAQWVIDNHIYTIEKSSAKDIVDVFNSIISSRNRTIFVSLPVDEKETENHYKIIERVAKEINNDLRLKVKIKVDRVDWFVDGTSYEINNKILEMISNCGLLIGDLTYCNPNVYHEVGFLMGKSRALDEGFGNFILILNETVKKKDNVVGFNLKGIKQIKFVQTEKFADELKKHLIKFFKLK